MLNQFKSFILNETKHYLGEKSGDILTALQNLQDDAGGMGNRALIRACQSIVNQIRKVLHGRWEDEDTKYLKQLQKIGVAIMKSIDDNSDMQEVISSSVAELTSLLDKLQVPINSLGSEGGGQEAESLPKEEPMSKGSELST